MESCPLEVTVETFTELSATVRQDLTCEPCNETCLTCSASDITVCTECKDGFKMHEKNKECLLECPSTFAEFYIPLTEDTICVKCADGC